SAVPTPSRTRPRSVLWAMASPQSFTATGKPIRSAASAASSGVATTCSCGTGMPYTPTSRFDAASERVVAGTPKRYWSGAEVADQQVVEGCRLLGGDEVAARQLDEAGPGDAGRQLPALFDRRPAVLDATDHERRCRDGSETVGDVDALIQLDLGQ